MKKMYHIILFLISSPNYTIQSKEITLDRVIVQINQHHYTQREIEAYLSCKQIINVKKNDSPFLIFSRENWLKSIEFFVQDTLFETEASRVSIYTPTNDLVEEEIKKIILTKNENTQINKFFTKLSLSKEELFQIIKKIIKVDKFVRYREIAGSNEEVFTFSKRNPKHLVSLYKNAHIYKTINPMTIRKLQKDF